ncbi:MAG: GNAT family N-acetyltransferase [Alphaproteobacteria bacterium]|nr:GNAT family N-acetyltransferase [Alphaproteobacteria bacterium]
MLDKVATWQPMLAADLKHLKRLSDLLFPDYLEDYEVLEERWKICPLGCFILKNYSFNAVGYALAHPAKLKAPPKENRIFIVPEDADCFHIHDICMLYDYQGYGYAGRVLRDIAAYALERGFNKLAIVAVHNSRRIWEKYGFKPLDDETYQQKIKADYGDDCFYMVRTIEA